ncbi:hypothetical protein EYF80_058016 [Liparis tanakae]|uniref:Uncharacterized protein n=1 Tax=Liparis tanakae TaxID=230148 RepID=A0A4Z2ESQ6_9TELE|nr:hypothetical protein EYF80_058016 [Liparis tanakae]
MEIESYRVGSDLQPSPVGQSQQPETQHLFISAFGSSEGSAAFVRVSARQLFFVPAAVKPETDVSTCLRPPSFPSCCLLTLPVGERL